MRLSDREEGRLTPVAVAVEFATSGVQTPLWVPFLVGVLASLVTAPAGLSGAFLLLPFQFSVLGFTSPAVSATNLVFNCLATAGGTARYARDGAFRRHLVGPLVVGTLPAVVAGAYLRVTVFAGVEAFKLALGLVLGALGLALLVRATSRRTIPVEPDARIGHRRLIALGVVSGVMGGVVGVGGGGVIAPVLALRTPLPVRLVAAATIAVSFCTTVVGLASYQVLAWTSAPGAAGMDIAPDWALGAVFGAGGLLGSYLGARQRSWLNERAIRGLLGALLTVLAVVYLAPGAL